MIPTIEPTIPTVTRLIAPKDYDYDTTIRLAEVARQIKKSGLFHYAVNLSAINNALFEQRAFTRLW